MEEPHQTREQQVFAFQKNSREEVRVCLTNWQGHALVDLRVFARQSDGEWVPTRKGLTLSRSLLPELAAAVGALGKAIGDAPQD
jgi:hypothetical protein